MSIMLVSIQEQVDVFPFAQVYFSVCQECLKIFFTSILVSLGFP